MGHHDAMSPEHYGAVRGATAPFPVLGEDAITLPFFDQFGPKLDLRMGHHDAMLPEGYRAVRGGAAPFPTVPPSKWRPFNNSVIFQPICFKFG